MVERMQIVDVPTFGRSAMNTLARYIQDEMARQGMNLLDLEAATGVPDSTLSRYVNGTVKNPRASVLAKIAHGLGVDWATMMDLAGLTAGVAARDQEHVPADVAALLGAQPWLLDLTRAIGALPPGQQRAVVAFIRHLLDSKNGPQFPPAGG